MNKKIIVIGLIVMMLAASSPVYAVSLNKNNGTDILEKEEKTDIEHYEDIDLVLDNSEAPIVQTVNNSENQTGYNVGWLNIETKGKGIKLFYPIDILRISHPVSTLQSPALNPFSLTFYMCYIVYNDPNATTKITSKDGNFTYINGSHSLVTGFIGSHGLFQFKLLINNGVIDGIGFPFVPHPLANIISSIVNLIPGAPFINSSKSLDDFLEPFVFMPTNLNATLPFANIRFFNIGKVWDRISNFTENNVMNFLKNFPIIFSKLGPALSMLPGLAFPGWALYAPWWFFPRTIPFPYQPIINSLVPGTLHSYSLFAWYNKEPNNKMLERCNKIQIFSEKWFGGVFEVN